MGRRIRWLGLIMILCLSAVVVQLVNIQLVRGPSLRESAANPRNASKVYDNQRGNIYASDGTLLAQSVRAPSAHPYLYVRRSRRDRSIRRLLAIHPSITERQGSRTSTTSNSHGTHFPLRRFHRLSASSPFRAASTT